MSSTHDNLQPRAAAPAASTLAAPTYSSDYLYNYFTQRTQMLEQAVGTLARVLRAVPRVIVSGTLDVANTVAGKLQAIGDAFRGDKNEGQNTNFVQIKQAHYDYLENVRKTNRAMYRKLQQLAKYYESMSPEMQDKLLLLFFDPQQLRKAENSTPV